MWSVCSGNSKYSHSLEYNFAYVHMVVVMDLDFHTQKAIFSALEREHSPKSSAFVGLGFTLEGL